uniref:FHA domain-containing protein n=1 Tax=Anopheles farauti TaxID=69004 RepID=A0A182QW00_9DIPT
MWFLTNDKTKYIYYLVSKPIGHTVGRINADLTITGDDSISRNHAMLELAKDALKLTDTGSRYGSYVNERIATNSAISKDQPTILKVGDRVRFGRCGSIWTVGRVQFRCLTSTLVMTPELKTVLTKLGVELLPDYAPTTTHLIMPSITVTTKFLHCLVGQVPIVTPDFFHTIDSVCIRNGKPLPQVEAFLPRCSETQIKNTQHNFHPNVSRRNLFQGKEFIFLNTVPFNQYNDIIKLAGGVCLSAQQERIAKSRFLNPNVITIKQSTSNASQSQTFDSLSQYIAARGRRLVPELEIGLAIVHSSIEKYCNPDYRFAFNLEECNENTDDGGTLATNTVHHTERTGNGATNTSAEMHTIPETEHNTERKPVKAKHVQLPIKSAKSSPENVAKPSGSLFRMPPAVASTVNPPEERRKSKRVQEMDKSGKQAHNDQDSGLVKRARRNASPTPSTSYSSLSADVPSQRRTSKRLQAVESTTEANPSEDISKQATPTRSVSPKESVSYSPVVDSKQNTESEEKQSVLSGAGEIQATIPETQPTQSDSALSIQALQARGFRAVNHEPSQASGNPKKRRIANLQLALEDDDAFIFNEIVPVKKSKPEKTQKSSSEPSKPRSEEDQEDLFCFEGISVSQRRRTRDNPRAGSQQTIVTTDAPEASLQRSSATEGRTPTFSAKAPATDSPLHYYRQFVQPKEVEMSTAGWLSSTMCGLKLEDAKENLPYEMTIKTEPMDETDGLMDDADNKHWLRNISTVFQVLNVDMKLVAHRPTDVSGVALPCVSTDGRKNYKAFSKKSNFPLQRIKIPTTSICVQDANECL